MSTVPAAVTIVTLRQKLARVRRLHTRALRERDEARDEVVKLCQERLQLVAGRDEARAAIDRVRALRERCEQGARDNGDYYKRTSAQYEHGKAVVWDHVATELREILAALDGSGT